MDLEQELEQILSGAKELGSELLTKLVNATGNPTLAQILYHLIGSHVAVAKQVQQTPAGQQALQALQAKQAAAKAAAAAPVAAPAPAAAPAPDALAGALAGIAQALAGINAKLDAQAAPAAPVQPVQPVEGPAAPPVVG